MEQQLNTPLYNAMAAIARRSPRFFVPGHKGNPAAIGLFGQYLHWDVTELDGLDLGRPTGPLAESQANMATLYGAGASLYSASGSSSCIMAMLALFCGAGGAVVAARGCHGAAVRAMALLDIAPHWVLPGANGQPTASAIAAALAQSGAKAVYLTSPDYYGRAANLAAIARACHADGAVLLVDGAHGAHLRFLQPDAHALSLGADAVAESAHKTLPCLTPAAQLHLKNGALAPKARQCLNLFCSTSPAWPVLISLDLAAGQLMADASGYGRCAKQVAAVCAAFPGLCAATDDPLRLVLLPGALGCDAEAFFQGLQARGIAPEYFDGHALVLMASPWNTGADFDALKAAMEQLLQTMAPNKGVKKQDNLKIEVATQKLPLPQAACGIREASFAPSETLPVGRAAGRVMAGLHAPCPPGVPLVLPGERLEAPFVDALLAGGILQVDVLK